MASTKVRELDGRQQHLFKPETGWVRPASLPTVPSGALVAIDTETNDPGLSNGTGPSWHMPGQGWLCGVSWCWEGGRGYMPVRHPDSDCESLERTLEWLQDTADRCDLVFQNGPYDMGWTGLRPTRRVRDVHSMAVLLNENEYSYSLDSICGRIGIAGKDETLLEEAVVKYGGNPKKIKSFLHQLPARYVGPYAEQDAVATYEAARVYMPQLETQGLIEAFNLECDLTPYTVEMRRRGIRIDLDRMDQNRVKLKELSQSRLDELGRRIKFGRQMSIEDIRSPRSLQKIFDQLGIKYPRTPGTDKAPDGNPSFEKEWLERLDHPVGKLIAQARGLHDGAEKFIGTYIADFLERGRLHAEVHQLRDAGDGSSSGTKTYRFSYSNPPLQQMNRAEPDKATPGHKDYAGPDFVDIGTLIRECFLPEPGCVWSAPDYSQQEYRLIVHYAARLGLPKAEDAVHYYKSDPKADYHNFVVQMTGLIRKRAKDCNFAKAFGAGVPKFALMTGMTLEEAASVMKKYDEELPFVSMFAQFATKQAESKGYVKLLDGRRCRFDEWEAAWIPREEWDAGRENGKLMTPCSIEEAHARQQDRDHPWRGKRLKRAGAHKAGNRVIQGGAAVQTKKAMLACCQEGYIPMLQMHDELCFPHDTERGAERTAEIMRDVVELLVPTKIDNEHGPDWGRAKYSFREAMEMVRRAA